MSIERLFNLNPTISEPSENRHNKHVKEAYSIITLMIAQKIERDFHRAWQKFPRLERDQIKEPDIISEFYTSYCSVKLIERKMNYIILLTVTEQAFKAGQGINSTALLRIAFNETENKVGTKTDNCLEIAVDNNMAAVYKQKVNETIDRENEAYLNRRLQIHP